MRIVDRSVRVVEVELDEALEGDGWVRVTAIDSMRRGYQLHCPGDLQPRVSDELHVIVEKP